VENLEILEGLFLSPWHLLIGLIFLIVQGLLIRKLILSSLQQKKMEKALITLETTNRHLEARERRSRLVAENMKDVLWILDVESMHFIFGSPSISDTLGFTTEEFLALPLEALLHSSDKKLILDDILERAKELRPCAEYSTIYMREMQQICKDGTMLWVEMSMYYYVNEETNKIEIQGIGRSIQKRKETEFALALSEERLRTITNNLPLIVYQIVGNDLEDATLTFVSDQVKNFIGKDVPKELSYFLEMVHPEDQALLQRTRQESIITNSHWQCEIRVILEDKQLRWIHGEAIPYHLPDGKVTWNGYCQDITERKNWEERMSQLERFHLIGEMAAGIAHEIRNPMTTVRGFLQSFMAKDEFFRFRSSLTLMISELDRANSIITEYLSLAKNKQLNLSLLSLNTIIEKILPLIEPDILLKGLLIDTKLATNLPDLPLDSQEMRQMILNFVRNGMEAMDAGGQLTIGTYRKDERVTLFIRDEGKGIPEEILDKLGTPFLTTKDTGTGLGLAICYNIANRHNAKIDVETGSRGTTFMVTFNV